MQFKDFLTLQRGYDLPKKEMQDGPYPVVGSTSIIGWHNEFKAQPPGVVLGRSGSLGTIQFIKEPYWPHNTSLWVKDFKGNDPRFVYYVLHGIDFARFNAGAGVPTLNRNHLDRLEIKVPALPIQRRIAGILSAYDDLIENNTRRIKILEEMARAIYREWFVELRAPAVTLRNATGEERKVTGRNLFPLDWEIGKLCDALILQRGFDLPVQDRRAGPVPVYAATGVVGTHDEARVKGPGVVTGRSGSLGTVLYVEEDFWPLNTTLWVKEFRRSTPLWAFYILNDLGLGNFNSGVAVPTLNRNDIHGLSVVLPPLEVMERFGEVADPMIKLKSMLSRQSENARRTRDMLLPRLISGDVSVDGLNIAGVDDLPE